MNKKSKSDIEHDVLNKLASIANHFALRDDYCSELPLYTQADAESQTSKSKDLENLLTVIQNEEISICHELVAIKDDVEKYLSANGLNKKEVEMVSAFKPFRLAAKFANQKELEKIDKESNKKYYSLVFENNAALSKDITPVIAYVSFVDDDEKLISVIDLILDVTKIWGMFLLHNADINTAEFEGKLLSVINRRTLYSSPTPKDYAQTIAEAFKGKPMVAVVCEKKRAIEKDIYERLGGIAFYYEERDDLNKELAQYTGVDVNPSSVKYGNLQRLLFQIKTQEVNALYELVHLKDNVSKYLEAFGSGVDDIKVIDEFKLFRMAANFVNTHKHGIRGRNAKSAKHDYTVFAFKRKGDKSSPDDPIVRVINYINFDGILTPARDVILYLIKAWQMFLKYHTKIDLDPFSRRISMVRSRHEGESTYSTPMPQGLIKDAKRKAEERKKLDIS
ncbi:MAG: hypothetical protein ACYC7L_11865 [Nitrospirota bacterium]